MSYPIWNCAKKDLVLSCFILPLFGNKCQGIGLESKFIIDFSSIPGHLFPNRGSIFLYYLHRSRLLKAGFSSPSGGPSLNFWISTFRYKEALIIGTQQLLIYNPT
jgi:hypothetical protein